MAEIVGFDQSTSLMTSYRHEILKVNVYLVEIYKKDSSGVFHATHFVQKLLAKNRKNFHWVFPPSVIETSILELTSHECF